MKIISFKNFSDECTNVYETQDAQRAQKIKREDGTIPVTVSGDNGPELVQMTPEEINKIDGVSADKNGSAGEFAVDEPIERDEKFFDALKWTSNVSDVMLKILAKKPFFVQGRAGWAKTSVIKDIARRHGYHVLTLYLDKMPAEELGGIPWVKQDEDMKTATVQYAMPWWAAYMLVNKDKKFLLFLDKINQASSETLHAVMPICLENVVCNIKFDNFFVGAAGNMQEEDYSLTEIPSALLSRFGGVIKWECNWVDAFEYLHEVWDDKIGKELVDLFEDHADNFKSPRDIALHVFDTIHDLKQSIDDGDSSRMKKNLQTVTLAKQIARQTIDNNPEEDYINDLAMECYAYITGLGASSQSSNKSGNSNTNKQVQAVANMIREGWTDIEIRDGDATKRISVPVTKDNIYKLYPDICKDIVDAAERILLRNHDKWFYESTEDALKDPKWTNVKEIIKEINEQE